MEGRSMSDVVWEFVPDCRAVVCKSLLAWWLRIDRDLKETSVRGGTKLSRRNINLQNVGKALRTGASDRRKPDGRERVVDSLMDWKPMKCMQKWGNMVRFWWPEDYSGCVVLDFLKFPETKTFSSFIFLRIVKCHTYHFLVYSTSEFNTCKCHSTTPLRNMRGKTPSPPRQFVCWPHSAVKRTQKLKPNCLKRRAKRFSL